MIAQASGHPNAAPSSATRPTTAWLKRGAQASITSVSRQGSAVRRRRSSGRSAMYESLANPSGPLGFLAGVAVAD